VIWLKCCGHLDLLIVALKFDVTTRNGSRGCSASNSKAKRLLLLLQKQRPEVAGSDDSPPPSPTGSQDTLQGTLQRKADAKRALLHRPEYDPPARVADGLFIGELLALLSCWPACCESDISR
jgi:hypothetical protein